MTILIDHATGIKRDSNDLCKTKDDHIERICGNMWSSKSLSLFSVIDEVDDKWKIRRGIIALAVTMNVLEALKQKSFMSESDRCFFNWIGDHWCNDMTPLDEKMKTGTLQFEHPICLMKSDLDLCATHIRFDNNKIGIVLPVNFGFEYISDHYLLSVLHFLQDICAGKTSTHFICNEVVLLMEKSHRSCSLSPKKCITEVIRKSLDFD